MIAIIDNLAWIRIVDRKLPVVRSHAKCLIYLPGGKCEQEESDQQALAHEIRQGRSIELKPASIIPALVFTAQAEAMPEGVEVPMPCYSADFEGRLRIANEIAEIRWLDSVDRTYFSLAGKRVVNHLVGKGLID